MRLVFRIRSSFSPELAEDLPSSALALLPGFGLDGLLALVDALALKHELNHEVVLAFSPACPLQQGVQAREKLLVIVVEVLFRPLAFVILNVTRLILAFL